MHSLHTDHPLAISLLLNEEIYAFDLEHKELPATPQPVPNSIEEVKGEIKLPPQEERVNPQMEEKPSYKYLGENNKYVLILLNDPESEFINQTDLIFLLKILAAKQLELKDIAIVNLAYYPSASFENLKDFFACNKILTFGINPAVVNIHGLKANQVLEHQGVKFLGTWSLRQMVNDDNKKKTYWSLLKPF